MAEASNEYDHPWKEALERALADFFALLFPDIGAQLDFSVPPRFLDPELSQIAPDAPVGPLHADRLVSVKALSGEERWVYIHIEVQSQKDNAFEERMFGYHARIWDRFRRPITSLAVLGDTQPEWRPDQFYMEQFGCETRFRFPVVKLLDLDVERLLEAAPTNLFTVVVAAHRAAQGTKGNERLRATVNLAKRLYGMGLTTEEVKERLRFLEWVIGLTAEQELSYRSQLEAYEETKMPYVLSFERVGIEKGLEEGLKKGLEQGRQDAALTLCLRQLRRKIGAVSEAQEEALRSLPVERLEALADALLDFSAPEDLDNWLRSNASDPA